MKSKKKRNIKYAAFLCGTMVIALLGIFVPGKLLALQSESELGQVTPVPEQYYSAAGSAMARNASAHLGFYEKMQLITGKWESETANAASYEVELEDYEAVETARKSMKELYDKGLYPSDLSTDYGNWYVWAAEPFKAVDTTFHTYTAYYWKIQFEKYDGLEKHMVYMLEDGTVFLTDAYMAEGMDKTAIKEVAEGLEEKDGSKITPQNPGDGTIADWVSYSGVETTDLQWKSLVQITQEEETYFALQAISDTRYFFAVTP